MRPPAFVALLFALVVNQVMRSQCLTSWLQGDGVPGVLRVGGNASVRCTTMRDPDGVGPLASRLVVAGDFSFAGDIPANHVAEWNPSSGLWTALGAGVSGPSNSAVSCMVVLPNGDLVVGGWFTSAGGVAASNIARWNGSAWSAFGSGINGAVGAMAVLANGDLVAGGSFSSAGGTATSNVARWDGSSWHMLGLGTSGSNPSVSALLVLPAGDLVAGGAFTSAGGVAVNHIARWDGSTWSALGPGTLNYVTALAVQPGGDIIAAVPFEIMRWNGSSWTTLATASGFSGGAVYAMTVLPNGDLIAGGSFSTIGSVSANRIARWDGLSWSALGWGLTNSVHTVTALPSGDLVAGGVFTATVNSPTGSPYGVAALGLSLWNGVEWSALSPGLSSRVDALATLHSGDVVAGGMFLGAGNGVGKFIARWDGSAWSSLGVGVGGSVQALTVLSNGDLVVGGGFTTAGGAAAMRVARWNGTSWFALGSGMNSSVEALTVLPNGNVVAGGSFTSAGGAAANYVAAWNGSAWSALGSGMDWDVRAFAVLPNGDLVAGGRFTSAGGVSANRVARWNGTSWSPLGSGLNGTVSALAVLPNGHLVAGGEFTTAGGVSALGVARWDGASWLALGIGINGSARALVALANGDVVAGGTFIASGPANRIGRWNGTSWVPLGSGVAAVGEFDNSGPIGVYALAIMQNGDVVAGGNFTTAGGVTSAGLARLTTTCPATATAIGVGCVGSGGANALSAITLPWLGSTFRATATGMPSLAFVLAVTGFAPVSIPLNAILPQGVAGCDLLASPDLIDVSLPAGGVTQTQVVLPNTFALASLQFYHQVVVLEVDLGLNITAITSTNGLALTMGVF